MDAVIDAGNSLVKVGLFLDGKLDSEFSFASGNPSLFYYRLRNLRPDRCILSSVGPVPLHIINYLRAKSRIFVEMTPATPLPIRNAYGSPATLGMDRLALAAGAAARFPEQDVLIIGAGTCITYNLLTADRRFTGGAISPGLNMRLQSMHHFTAALPLVNLEETLPPFPADNTPDSLLAGAVFGAAFEVRGFISQLRKQFPSLVVILAGGDARRLGAVVEDKIEILPDLGLFGLYEILAFNDEQKN